MSSPLDVVKLLQDTLNTQPTIVGQPNDDDLLALKEKILNVLQTVSYDRADGVHHVIGVIQSNTAYKADHNGVAFSIPKRLGLWDDKIAGATDEPFTRAANSIMPAATTDVMDALASSLDNLALAATSDKTAL
jgi:hypothetical protein